MYTSINHGQNHSFKKLSRTNMSTISLIESQESGTRTQLRSEQGEIRKHSSSAGGVVIMDRHRRKKIGRSLLQVSGEREI